MQFRKHHVQTRRMAGSIFSGMPTGHIRVLTLACLAATFALSGAAQAVPPPSGTMAPPGSPDRPLLVPEANNLPDLNTQMKMREGLTKQQNFTAANAERRKQIADDTARLLKMATDLKAEVDKTTKDTLSLTVIRKADEIERLAHIVKEKMKLTVGTN